MNDLFEYLGMQLAELIPDLEVRKAKSNIVCSRDGKVWDPFANHLYATFIVMNHEALSVSSTLKNRFLPCAQSLAKFLNQFQIVETQALQLPQEILEAKAKMVQVGSLPVRFIATHDVTNQGTRIIVDLLVRHVGNFHRTIINGPMHRFEMPFKSDPADLEIFDYNYLPPERPDYYQDVVGEDDGSVRVLLPGLDEAGLYPEYRHIYWLKGNYCYYRGESLHS